MKRVKVKLIGKGTIEDPWRVDLPTWVIDGDPDYVKKECYVRVRDDETKEVQGKTVLHQERIREKYRENWSEFNASDVEILE